MSFWDALFGGGGKMKQVSNWDEQQKELYNRMMSGGGIEQNPMYQQGSNWLQQILSGSPEAFSAFEAPYKRQFQEETVPGLAERFAGMGTGSGGMSSSGFNQAMAHEAGTLSENLAAMRGQMQQGAVGQALGYAEQPFSNQMSMLQLRPHENYYQQGSPGLMGYLGGMAGQAMGGGLGRLFGGGGGGGSYSQGYRPPFGGY